MVPNRSANEQSARVRFAFCFGRLSPVPIFGSDFCCADAREHKRGRLEAEAVGSPNLQEGRVSTRSSDARPSELFGIRGLSYLLIWPI
jgi:hypothetical protein